MKLLLKKGVDWSGKYGFEDIGHLRKSKRVGSKVIYITEVGEGQYRAPLWTFERTKETRAFLQTMIENGDARLEEADINAKGGKK